MDSAVFLAPNDRPRTRKDPDFFTESF